MLYAPALDIENEKIRGKKLSSRATNLTKSYKLAKNLPF